jgi:hypothetical protein
MLGVVGRYGQVGEEGNSTDRIKPKRKRLEQVVTKSLTRLVNGRAEKYCAPQEIG